MPAIIIEFIVILAALIVSAVPFFQGGMKDVGLFWDLSAFAITLGGTFIASLLHFSFRELFGAIRFLKELFFKRQIYPENMANVIIELSSLYKANGREGLKVVKDEIKHPILRTALNLLTTETELEEFSEILSLSIKNFQSDLKKYEHIFYDMRVYALMSGFLGTVAGLIKGFYSPQSAANIGITIASALIATLYGIIFAGIVLLPISGKIKLKGEIESKNSQIILDGFMMIRKGQGTFAIEQRLRTHS